ncbi:hypothetical protein HPB50_014488 [Hyalomma asiaticum]|uniref:Uncharacterized protein n=1 Tax=Hyalomma asiaticum TaxID=266040 RepID=A0ACB7SHW1_HYAAI|nr:hypothetical protein HPB50_014488 [Hyalomma asiaticum]
MTGEFGRPEGPCHRAARRLCSSQRQCDWPTASEPCKRASGHHQRRTRLQRRQSQLIGLPGTHVHRNGSSDWSPAAEALRPGARCRVNMRRRTVVLVRWGGVCDLREVRLPGGWLVQSSAGKFASETVGKFIASLARMVRAQDQAMILVENTSQYSG